MKYLLQEYFLNALFDRGEQTCFASAPFHTAVFPAIRPGLVCETPYFSINPMHTSRADANVTQFRNFLVEFDGLSAVKQMETMKDVPWTTCVWSGGKSYHFIISLVTPAANRAEYDQLMSRILAKLPDADKTARNPSRLSRLGGAIRDNGEKQTIMDIKRRISRVELEAWLGPELPSASSPKPTKQPSGMRWHLDPLTLLFLREGAPAGHWNRSLFLATLDMVRANWPIDEIYDKLEAITGHLDKTDRRTILSAIKAVQHEDL